MGVLEFGTPRAAQPLIENDRVDTQQRRRFSLGDLAAFNPSPQPLAS
jgi:hypothetical protein